MAQRFTGSISRGKTAEKHNTRECYAPGRTPANIDRRRSWDNVVYIDHTLEELYEARFGEAARAYSAAQVEKGHQERQVPDYLAKVRADKKLQPMYEFVVQVGNVDEHPTDRVACEVYASFLDNFQARWGANFAVKQAIVHLDEATPHMHLEVVPVAQSKRGLSVQNSMNKAVQQAGFADYKDMLAGWDELLTECMERQAIERVAGDRERQMGGVDIDTYRRSMAAKAEAEKAEAKTEELAAEIEASSARLEEHRHREERAAAELGELREAASPSLGEGLSAQARNPGLEREESELRSAVGELERQVAEAESGVEDAQRGVERARSRNDRARISYGHAFRLFEQALNWVLAQVKELPRRVYELFEPGVQAIVEDADVRIGRDKSAMTVAERIAAAQLAADDLRQRQRGETPRDKAKGDDAR